MRAAVLLFGLISLVMGFVPLALQAPASVNIAMYETGPDTTLALWPEKPLNSDGSPSLNVYYTQATKPHNKVILICPGGGYGKRAPHEGHDVARFFNNNGYHAAVLQYRVAPFKWPNAYADGRKAFSLLKNQKFSGLNAPEWVLMGFSAGGHLAACLATLPDLTLPDSLKAPKTPKLNALILAYPVISFTKFVHEGSKLRLLGPNPDPELVKLLSLEKQVKPSLCRTFLFHTEDDASVPIENSEMFLMACHKAGVPVYLEKAKHGKHGVGLALSDTALNYWPTNMLRWLENEKISKFGTIIAR